jgi:hypothetical protein
MNQKLTNILLALLIYLPTCAFISLYVYLLLICIVVVLNKNFLIDFFTNLFHFKVLDKNFLLISAFSVCALILRLSDYSNWDTIKDFYSFAYLFPFTYLIAKTINDKNNILNYFVYFIVIECFFAFVEYILGVSTIFDSLKLYREFDSYELLYYTRVFGLNPNSSGLAIKLIFGLLILDIRPFKVNQKLILSTLFLATSIIVFGRIALIVIVFYHLLKLFNVLFITKQFNFKEFIPFFVFTLIFSINPTWTKKQFTRNNIEITTGRLNNTDEMGNSIEMSTEELYIISEKLGIGKIDMSGRNEIWNSFFKFWLNHPHFGNKGAKFKIGKYHAHNSFLELLTSFGLYLFIGMMFIIFFNINKDNYVYVFPILLLAFGQYLIFWGISLYDILFYYILFFYNKNK